MIRGGLTTAGRGASITATVVAVENVGIGVTRWYFDVPVDGVLEGFRLETLDVGDPGNYQPAGGVVLISPGVFEVVYGSDTDGGWRIFADPKLLIGSKPVRIVTPVVGSMA